MPIGRPRELDLHEAVFVTLVYARHNVTEELLGELMGLDQSQIFRIILELTSIVELVTAPYVSTEQDATEALSGQVALADGTQFQYDEVFSRLPPTLQHHPRSAHIL